MTEMLRRLIAIVRTLLATPGRLLRWIVALPERAVRWLRSLPARAIGWVRALPTRGRAWVASIPNKLVDLPRRAVGLGWRGVAIGVAVLAVVALVVARRSAPEPLPVATVAILDQLEIVLPPSIDAGDPIAMTVRSASERDEMIDLTIDTGYGIERIAVRPVDGVAELTVGPLDVPASRTMLVTAAQGDAVATATMHIDPGEAVGPIDVYLGPRTIVADTEHFTMIVAVPEDEHGNPVADDTVVDYLVTRPTLATEAIAVPTDNLLAWIEVFSGTSEGRTRVATSIGDAGAPERSVIEIADLPEPYVLELLDPLSPADGQALLRVRTTLLVDVNGNVMPDGTTVLLDANGVTGVRRLTGQTIDGLAEFVIEVPDRPGAVTLQATASGVPSEQLSLEFAPAVTDLDAVATRTDDVTIIDVGPVRSVRNSFVPDGTEVVVDIDGQTYVGETFLGVGTIFVDDEVVFDEYDVAVLGYSERFEVDP